MRRNNNLWDSRRGELRKGSSDLFSPEVLNLYDYLMFIGFDGLPVDPPDGLVLVFERHDVLIFKITAAARR